MRRIPLGLLIVRRILLGPPGRRRYRRLRRARRLAGALAAVVASVGLALSGGLAVPVSSRGVIDDAARVAAEVQGLADKALREWCPQVFEANGKQLTHNGARACLKRTEEWYLGLLRKAGLNTGQIPGWGK